MKIIKNVWHVVWFIPFFVLKVLICAVVLIGWGIVASKEIWGRLF